MLNRFAISALISFSTVTDAVTEKLEKPNLKFGFIKLTDSTPVAIAHEKGVFNDAGLTQANRKTEVWHFKTIL